MRNESKRTPERRSAVLTLARLMGEIDKVNADRIATRVSDAVESKVRVEKGGCRS